MCLESGSSIYHYNFVVANTCDYWLVSDNHVRFSCATKIVLDSVANKAYVTIYSQALQDP